MASTQSQPERYSKARRQLPIRRLQPRVAELMGGNGGLHFVVVRCPLPEPADTLSCFGVADARFPPNHLAQPPSKKEVGQQGQI